MSVKKIPEGYQQVIPYFIVGDAAGFIEFLKKAFDAREKSCTRDREGRISHAELRVGDCIVMAAQTSSGWKAMASSYYFYVEDVDAVYRRALEAGAKSVMEPADQFYGDRNAGVQDLAGNYWYIGTRIEDLTEEELQRRSLAAGR